LENHLRARWNFGKVKKKGSRERGREIKPVSQTEGCMLSSQGNGHVSRPVDGKIKQLVNQKKKVQTLLKLFRTSTPPEKNPENFPILFYLHPESTTMYYQYTAFLKSIFTMT